MPERHLLQSDHLLCTRPNPGRARYKAMSVCSISPKYFTRYTTLPLLLKLIEMGMDPYLIRRTKSYLAGRPQFICVLMDMTPALCLFMIRFTLDCTS